MEKCHKIEWVAADEAAVLDQNSPKSRFEKLSTLQTRRIL